jgi:hypothetical protein
MKSSWSELVSNKEVNNTDLSPSVRIPWNDSQMLVALGQEIETNRQEEGEKTIVLIV